ELSAIQFLHRGEHELNDRDLVSEKPVRISTCEHVGLKSADGIGDGGVRVGLLALVLGLDKGGLSFALLRADAVNVNATPDARSRTIAAEAATPARLRRRNFRARYARLSGPANSG